jgi:hypothetical protein
VAQIVRMLVFRRPLLSSRIPHKLDLRSSAKFTPTIPFRPISTPFKPRDVPFRPLTSFVQLMPTAIPPRRRFSPDIMSSYPSDSPMKSPSAMLSFNDTPRFASPDSDQMLFGPLDFEDYSATSPVVPWDPFSEMDNDVKPLFDFPASSSLPSHYDYDISQSSPTESYYDSAGSYDVKIVKSSPTLNTNDYLASWINDPDLSLPVSPTSPISIPSSMDIPDSSSFVSYTEQNHFPRGAMLSPTAYAALHPLPRSMSPASSFEDHYPVQRQRINSISPQDTSLHTPSWASQLWDAPSSLRSPTSPRSAVRHSPMHDATLRQRVPTQRGSISSGQLFQSSSAPSPTMTRSYSRRAESVSVTDDHDATLRRKKRSPPIEDPNATVKAIDNRKCHIIFSF